MRAVVIHEAGGPAQLKLEERPIPKVKPGWSLMQIKAFGLNHAESITRKGGSPAVHFPRVIGIEAVGVVADSTTDKLKVGEPVMTTGGEFGRAFDGGYEEYALIPNSQIYPLPIKENWAQLATIPESGYTAMGAIKVAQVKAHQHVLVRGGTSTVGIAATKLMKAMGVTVAATTRRETEFAFLKAQGADETILDKDNQLQTKDTFDAIIEFVGEKTLPDSLQHLKAYGGYCCLVGELANEWTANNWSTFMIPSGAYLSDFQSSPVKLEWLQEMVQLIQDNHLEFPIGATFKLDEIVKAHELLDAGTADGKIVVVNQ